MYSLKDRSPLSATAVSLVFNFSCILRVGWVFESPKAYSIASEARRWVREGHPPCKYSQVTQVIDGGKGNK